MPDADAAQQEPLDRLDALERELDLLAEQVTQSLSRLRAELSRARAGVHDLHASTSTPAPAAPAEAPEGARLIALDLVLRGVPRESAERELATGFPEVDAAALLDEAQASTG